MYRRIISNASQDAYILATVLGHRRTTRANLPRALRIFDEIRRPAATAVVEASRMNGRYFSFEVDGIDFARYSGPQLWDKLQNLSGALVKNWEWSAFSLSLVFHMHRGCNLILAFFFSLDYISGRVNTGYAPYVGRA